MCIISCDLDFSERGAIMMRHLVQCRTFVKLQNAYLNMLTDFETKNFTTHEVAYFAWHIFTKRRCKDITSSLAIWTTCKTPNWESKNTLKFQIQEFEHSSCAFFRLTQIFQKETQEQCVILCNLGHLRNS